MEEQSNNYVYFMRNTATGLIKIGRSFDPQKRRTSIESRLKTPIEILAIEPAPDREKELHNRFAALRKDGEWFEAGRDLLKYIKSLPKITDIDPLVMDHGELWHTFRVHLHRDRDRSTIETITRYLEEYQIDENRFLRLAIDTTLFDRLPILPEKPKPIEEPKPIRSLPQPVRRPLESIKEEPPIVRAAYIVAIPFLLVLSPFILLALIVDAFLAFPALIFQVLKQFRHIA